MSFSQKFLLNTVLSLVTALNFLERKLFSLIRGITALSINAVTIGFVLANGYLLPYLVAGISPDSYSNLVGYPVLKTVVHAEEKEVLGASTVSLVRELPAPAISAKVALVVARKTGNILFDLNSNQAVAPASTTKLMTALVALDLYNPSDVLEVPVECTQVDGSMVGLPAGKSFTVESLLNALLIQSGADAACVLANGKITYDEFVGLMNDKAKEIGMTNTSLTNPVGLDGVNGSHYSTAADLYVLSDAATKNNLISSMVKTKEYIVSSVDESTFIKIGNTNKLLWEIGNTVGVKTGTTAAAGEVLIYEYVESDKNVDIVIVVLNSSDRFFDTKSLLNWTLGSYSWVK